MQINNISQNEIDSRIFSIRGKEVMVDRDLAEMYAVETKVLNQAVKRNLNRFPDSFRFQLSILEKNELVTNCDRFEILKHSTQSPYVFTEQGVAMLSAVLRSDTAIMVSIQIINAFVEMRKLLWSNAALFQRIDRVELKQIENDQKFERLFNALENKNSIPEMGVFYDGQIFDAYTFVSNIVRSANKSIVLIDNYIDDSVLTLFTKRAMGVSVVCYTQKVSKEMALDLEKHNAQYPLIQVKEIQKVHDRFLIIDSMDLYHIGASMKDLGKKWFAFSKMNAEVATMMEQINNIKKD